MVPSPTIEGYFNHHLSLIQFVEEFHIIFNTEKILRKKTITTQLTFCTCLLLTDIVPPSSSVSIGGSGGLRVNPSGITESFT